MRRAGLLLLLALAACGVRGDLEPPNGVAPPKPVWTEGAPKGLAPPPRQVDDVNLIRTPDYVPKPAEDAPAQGQSTPETVEPKRD